VISRRTLLAGFAAAAFPHDTEYIAYNLLSRKEQQHWEGSDRAVGMGSLLKPFLTIAYARTHYSFPHIMCHGAADGCWSTKAHGEQDIVAALANSCNVYFRQLAAGINAGALASVCLSYGLEAPGGRFTPEQLIGLGSGWPQRPDRVVTAFGQLPRNRDQTGVANALAGMRRAARQGTARELRLSAYAKTGTAPCSHLPKADGDGYVAVLYPDDQPRLIALVRQCGTTGAHTAALAGPIVRNLI
jgi:hypothetical protein